MQFTQLPQCEHELVILRPIEERDLATWYDYLSMPIVFEHTSWNLSSSEELAPYVWNRRHSHLLRYFASRLPRGSRTSLSVPQAFTPSLLRIGAPKLRTIYRPQRGARESPVLS